MTINFFMLVFIVDYIFFDHLLWSIFQSSITHYNYNFFKFLHVHGDLLWAAFMYCLYTCLSDLWVLPSCIPLQSCSCLVILESSYTSFLTVIQMSFKAQTLLGLVYLNSWWYGPLTSVEINVPKASYSLSHKKKTDSTFIATLKLKQHLFFLSYKLFSSLLQKCTLLNKNPRKSISYHIRIYLDCYLSKSPSTVWVHCLLGLLICGHFLVSKSSWHDCRCFASKFSGVVFWFVFFTLDAVYKVKAVFIMILIRTTYGPR